MELMLQIIPSGGCTTRVTRRRRPYTPPPSTHARTRTHTHAHAHTRTLKLFGLKTSLKFKTSFRTFFDCNIFVTVTELPLWGSNNLWNIWKINVWRNIKQCLTDAVLVQSKNMCQTILIEEPHTYFNSNVVNDMGILRLRSIW